MNPTQRRKPTLVAIAAAMLTCGLAGCDKTSAADQTFVQPNQVAQWIVDHECSKTGAVKGYPKYGGEGNGQIAQETFVCDNGGSYDIRLQTNGTYKYTQN